jgi:hypothetical protein
MTFRVWCLYSYLVRWWLMVTYVEEVSQDSHGGDLAAAGRELIVNVDRLQGLGAGNQLAAVQP